MHLCGILHDLDYVHLQEPGYVGYQGLRREDLPLTNERLSCNPDVRASAISFLHWVCLFARAAGLLLLGGPS